MEIKKLKPKNRRYLGSKTKLLDKIGKIIDEECEYKSSFLDLFSGTGVVGEYFTKKSIPVIFNDILYSNYLTYISWFSNEKVNFEKIQSLIDFYNNSNSYIQENYVSDNFSNTYFSYKNCLKIGSIREDIDLKFNNGILNQREKAILITSLLLSADRIANTVGHYDAYRKNGDLNKELILYNLDIDTNNGRNMVYCEDANKLVEKVEADIVYIDPPYNSRQYSDAYHFLENIAEWEKMPVSGVAKKNDRVGKKSKYCLQNAPIVFSDLIKKIKAKYIIVSYNNMGNKGASRSNAKISETEIKSILSSRGRVLEYEIDYQQYSTGKSKIHNHKEIIYLCKIDDFSIVNSIEVESNNFVKSPLNYTGGKFKLLPQIISKFPANIENFIDLFGGGFNVGVNVQATRILYNDIQPQLVRLMRMIYTYHSEQIISEIEKVIVNFNLSNSKLFSYEYYSCTSNDGLGKYNKKGYIELRKHYNCLSDSFEKDIILLVLIIYSFNNQIRFNKNNEYNMPIGKRDFNANIRRNLLDFSILLKSKNIIFENKSFTEVSVPDNSFVYCDPPYLLGVASYNESNGWNKEKEEQLLKYLEDLSNRNIKFALSNVIEHKGEINLILNEWIERNRFNKIFIKSTYKNSNYQKKDKVIDSYEILVTNY